MQVSLAVLADCANITQDGKINVMGIFGEINPPGLPAVLPTMFLIIGFVASPAEVGTEKSLQIVLLDEDGTRRLQLQNNAVVPQPSRAGGNATLVSIIGLNNTVFERAGDYQFSILVNGEEKTTIPLRVNAVLPPIPEGER